MSFNPHPSRRTGATEDDAHTLPPNAFQSSPVPEDGCNSWAGTCLWWAGMFQSSPVPEDGCNGRPARPRGRGRGGFNPHPSRRTGATGADSRWRRQLTRFNPHPSRRTGATGQICFLHIDMEVSILTRAGGRVQRNRVCHTGELHGVSILTRPGGRVQHAYSETQTSPLPFQSSPVPEDGCNPRQAPALRKRNKFQSSPVPEDGCNPQSCGPGSGFRRAGFNPHPSRRTGATFEAALYQEVRLVSILTRPGGRVQRV